ncbi:hypothetical protein WI560_23705 [Bradyrhizobium sp. A11]|uniref:hypothetical protein n=1 Tax=Bradyrhizobium sp. A11 TaxID=3133974 RepID=UPI00324BAD72
MHQRTPRPPPFKAPVPADSGNVAIEISTARLNRRTIRNWMISPPAAALPRNQPHSALRASPGGLQRAGATIAGITIAPPSAGLRLSATPPSVRLSDVAGTARGRRSRGQRERGSDTDHVHEIEEPAERRRKQTRTRMQHLRARAKLHRRDPVSFFSVPLHQSVIDELVTDLKVKQADDTPVDDRTWRRLVSALIAKAVKLAVKKRP